MHHGGQMCRCGGTATLCWLTQPLTQAPPPLPPNSKHLTLTPERTSLTSASDAAKVTEAITRAFNSPPLPRTCHPLYSRLARHVVFMLTIHVAAGARVFRASSHSVTGVQKFRESRNTRKNDGQHDQALLRAATCIWE